MTRDEALAILRHDDMGWYLPDDEKGGPMVVVCRDDNNEPTGEYRITGVDSSLTKKQMQALAFFIEEAEEENQIKEIEQFDKYRVRVKFREEMNGGKLKEHLQILNGQELVLQALYQHESTERYPNEWVFGRTVAGTREGRLFVQFDLAWLAQGDLVILENVTE